MDWYLVGALERRQCGDSLALRRLKLVLPAGRLPGASARFGQELIEDRRGVADQPDLRPAGAPELGGRRCHLDQAGRPEGTLTGKPDGEVLRSEQQHDVSPCELRADAVEGRVGQAARALDREAGRLDG